MPSWLCFLSHLPIHLYLCLTMHSKVSSAQFKNTVYSSNIDVDAPFSLNLGTLCHPDSVGPYSISSAQSCHARKREVFSKDLLSERTKQYLKGRSTSSCGGYHLPFIPSFSINPRRNCGSSDFFRCLARRRFYTFVSSCAVPCLTENTVNCGLALSSCPAKIQTASIIRGSEMG